MEFISTKVYGNQDRGKYYVVRDYKSTTTDDVIFRSTTMTKSEYLEWKRRMMSVVGASHEIESESPSQIVFVPLDRKEN